MSQKRSTLLIWAAVIFILIVTCLITDRNNLAERTLYSSQEEMQSALQDTFVYYTARGERQAWSPSMGIPQYKPMKTAQYFHIPLRNGIRSAVR